MLFQSLSSAGRQLSASLGLLLSLAGLGDAGLEVLHEAHHVLYLRNRRMPLGSFKNIVEPSTCTALLNLVGGFMLEKYGCQSSTSQIG